MRILHLSTTDIKGGAGIAAFRIHCALIDNGVDSQMFVQRKYSSDSKVLVSKDKFRKTLNFFCLIFDKIIAKIFKKNDYEIISPALFSSMNMDILDKINPDIVHINWVCGGFLSPEKISRIKQPIVWTMYDMWPFSGVSHYNGDNKDYISGNFSDSNFLDKWTWKRKKRAWSKLDNFIAVSPSKWLANEAKSSYLFKNLNIINIPNGINTKIFRKYDKIILRKKYNLPPDKKLLLFGAVNPLSGERKGYKLLINVIKEILKTSFSQDIALVIFGSQNDNNIQFNIPTYFMGKISSEKELAEIYSVADLFIAPSIEDNLPNTVMESMSCGTPVVAFHIGGMPDMIDNQINGILIKPFNTSLMAEEILNILRNETFRRKLAIKAREKILKEFDINLTVNKYLDLYKSILHK